jgi:Sulfatase
VQKSKPNSDADHEIGRVIDEVDRMGKLDNTLIIYISGDNGNSAEGSLIGTPNEVASLQGIPVPVEDQLKYFCDAWGTDRTYPHMAVGWTWAFDTPFSWTKQIASHFGGVRQGMAISWPKVIKDKGGVRNQFHHMIDIVPTILEATGIPTPKVVDGIAQKPIEGVSMMYTFDAKAANAPSRHKTQYFEMMGDHAIYSDGWIASTKVMRPPWDLAGAVSRDPAGFPYELYDLSKDWTQSDVVAAKYPAKLKEMENLFWTEAAKYQVLPLDATVATRVPTSKPCRRAHRVHLVRRDHRHTERRRAFHSRRIVQLQGRDRDSPGRRRRHDRHSGWPVRRLRVLPAQGQAGVPLQLRRPRAHTLGRPGRAHAGEAHARVRLQVCRARPRHARLQ